MCKCTTKSVGFDHSLIDYCCGGWTSEEVSFFYLFPARDRDLNIKSSQKDYITAPSTQLHPALRSIFKQSPWENTHSMLEVLKVLQVDSAPVSVSLNWSGLLIGKFHFLFITLLSAVWGCWYSEDMGRDVSVRPGEIVNRIYALSEDHWISRIRKRHIYTFANVGCSIGLKESEPGLRLVFLIFHPAFS